MTVSGLILELKKAAVDIRLVNKGLFLKSSKKSDSSELISEVSNHREDLIRYISKARSHISPVLEESAKILQHANGEVFQENREYWINKFSSNISTGNLPTDRPRSGVKTEKETKLKFNLDNELLKGLKKIELESGTTLYMNLIAITNLLLYKYTSQTEFIIGIPFSENVTSSHDNLLVNKNNHFPLWTTFDNEHTYSNLLDKVKDVTLGTFQYQEYSFAQLVEDLKASIDWSSMKMYDIAVAYKKSTDSNSQESKNKSESLESSQSNDSTIIENKLDLFLSFIEGNESLECNIVYNADLFTSDRIQKMFVDLCKIIKTAISNKNMPIREYSLLDDEETRTILESFSKSQTISYPKLKVLKEIETLCLSNLNRLALLEGEKKMTYKDLLESVNQLANYLIEQLADKSERRVGMLFNQGLDFTIAQLAIWKSGASSVWLNPNLDENTLIGQVRTSAPSIILSVRDNIKMLQNLQWYCKSLDVVTLLDSVDFYSEMEDGGLMEEAYWDAVNQSGDNEILSGGWTSSFDGKAFSENEIDEYKDNLLKKIDPYTEKYKNILEVGIGSGISTMQLADKAERFHGIDISKHMVKLTKRKLRKSKIKNAKCTHLPAHKLDQLGDKDFNLIVINSVINCFKGHNYFRQVFLSCIDLIDNEGIIFLGDVMDQDKKELFISDLKTFQSENNNSFTKTDWFDELFLSRSYLEQLCATLPFVKEIIIDNKLGTIQNELLKYRFDAVVIIDKNLVKRNDSISSLKLKSQHDSKDISKYPKSLDSPIVDIPDQAILKFKSSKTEEISVISQETITNNLQLFWNRYAFSNDKMMLRIGDSEIFTFPGNGGSLNYVNGCSKDVLVSFEQALNNHKVNGIQIDARNLKSICDKIDSVDSGLDYLDWVNVITSRLNPNLFNLACDTIKAKTNAKIEKLYSLLESDLIISFKSNPIDFQTIGEYAGRPVPGTSIYILQDNLQLVPIDIDGKLYISNILQDQSNNNSNNDLLINSYEKDTFISSKKIKARWLANGEFVVIDDEESKLEITKNLIEEIKYHLNNCPIILNSVVTTKAKAFGNIEIDLYWVKDEVEDVRFMLKTFLEEQIVIGDHKINYFEVPLIPIDPNGKVDMDGLGAPTVEPRTKVERELLTIWQDVLEKENIGVRMPFFQLGGDSIKALLLVSKINKYFNKSYLITDIFGRPSIELQAQLIDNNIEEEEDLNSKINPIITETESTLQNIFMEILELDKVGLDTDYTETYENKSTTDKLTLQINKQFDMNFQLEILFEYKTVTQLASEIDAIQWVNSHVSKEIESSGDYIEI